MAAATSLSSLLDTLTTSLSSLSESLPSSAALTPPADGISLLDTKNELFLSYLHNLVFLILLKLRHSKSQWGSEPNDAGENSDNNTQEEDANAEAATVKKLVELRVYLERGVKPLENKLHYQIDKVVRAADEAEARKAGRATNSTTTRKKKKLKTDKPHDAPSASESDSEASSTSSHSAQNQPNNAISDLAYRPNLAAFRRPTQQPSSTSPSNPTNPSKPSIYRPPRIAPTSLPPQTTTTSTSNNPTKSTPSRPRKSALLDEYVATELSSAPMLEPSIGSTIQQHGRREASARERREAAERTRYEEENLMRLPGMSKKEKRRAEKRSGGAFGGEEWSGLGGSAERIVELTGRGKGGGGLGALERSRKRGREEINGREGGGEFGGVGSAFEKRRRLLEARRERRRK